MFLTIDPDDKTPIYRQVADGIKSLIARRELAEGAQLPPVRQLAADLGVNLNTIAASYRELQEEGLITVKHGSGAVVSSSTTRPAEGNGNSDEHLRRPLRAALTELVLAGVPSQKILSIVTAELNGLLRKPR
jgi:DNA-binding transcriptional regulator YhcF (GntR family)